MACVCDVDGECLPHVSWATPSRRRGRRARQMADKRTQLTSPALRVIDHLTHGPGRGTRIIGSLVELAAVPSSSPDVVLVAVDSDDIRPGDVPPTLGQEFATSVE